MKLQTKNGVSALKKKKPIFEDNIKKIYATDEEGKLIVKFSDEVPLKSPNKTVAVKGKGAINNQIAIYLYKYLSSFHIVTHFLSELSDREMVIQSVEQIPVEIVVHNFVGKELADRFGLEETTTLNSPIQEYFLKDERQNNPFINQTHLQALGILQAEEFRMIERLVAKINAVMRSFFLRRQLQLVNFKLEFGKIGNKLVLAGDLSPDTIVVADMAEGQIDFNKFKITANSAADAYNSLKERILQG
ncbi:hypothetical protein B6D60_06380 [candidate division KSB1 bacterium 4484_87]|nr:MAG: hypothetical protein B6D60_06380 [candidate division KSB1 bacterium 4484_87]